MQTIFEKSQSRQHAYSLPASDSAFNAFHPPQHLLRQTPLLLPEISELDLTRHFSQLAHRNMSIDTNFYPLGSCTMKLNPRINEWAAALPGFTRCHPFAPDETVQGNLQLMAELIDLLCEMCGMAAGTLVSNAGAQGEFTGIRMISAYHEKQGDDRKRELLIPDSAHGTNPATAAMNQYKIISIRTNEKGDMDLEQLKQSVNHSTAGLMLTNPNTLGLFSPSILEISKIIHRSGGLLYYDGANLNPILNVARPGDMGFDVMHLNLHKTFSTPHGGGGPGSGPVLCVKRLEEFLPVPRIIKEGIEYRLKWQAENSIGHMASFQGNFAINVRAYLYAKLHGHFGLRKIAEQSVLNANYLKAKMEPFFTIPFSQPCMHEFVMQADRYLSKEIRALDIAKRLLDYGVHAPTIYFPLIIKECMLIEPTETESKLTLDNFIACIQKIVQEIESDPQLVKTAPHTLSVSRLDETLAARNPILKHQTSKKNSE
ncbi:aminomethyl-transferring glycine dehydrogenase subunit GcvPB [Parachlamydia acanthamoebae]|uniref:aminomethyl-transferring glycine dehydrogenase subunit GcvPB n=1 Tax=Parachlamydia acanthamoebae TaxID=83552 RepID=UPI0007518985|nr:aminomethyl-transferring glycine dehydrogenase subunit GcvPB [Parachlamydia acanthamoebae]